MPHDAVDSEVYIKTPKSPLRYPDGPMDFIHLDKEVELISHPQHDHQGQTQQISNRKGSTGTSACTRLLEDTNYPEAAAGLPGPTVDKGPMHLD